jgi:hypothetical protein
MSELGQTAPSSFVTAAAGLAPIADVPGGYSDPPITPPVRPVSIRVHSGEGRRLLINQPPRSLKSICVSVAYFAWLLGHDPTRRAIVASYSGDFAAELHRQFRMVVSSAWYEALFPTLRWAKETGLELITTQGGSRYATSVGGTLTGRGADLIIVDDPLNANEVHSEPARKRVINWYGGALVSRLNDKQTGSIVAVMQRLPEDDLAGHLLRQGGWDHLDMPAIALENEIIEWRQWVLAV